MPAPSAPMFHTRLASSADDLRAAQALRYQVFVRELGGDGPLVDHAAGLERDCFDDHADHLLLFDGEAVVGVYRLMQAAQAQTAGRWYSADEFDLSALDNSGKRLLELGRSCLHPDYRGGAGMMHLWQALAGYVLEHEIDVLFGVASFHGTDVDALAAPLSVLHHRHLAPEALRPISIGPAAIDMNRMPEAEIDRPAALRAVPALIKAYLRLGGCVGQGAWVDHAFNTTDVCLVMDTGKMSEKHRDLYLKGLAK